VSNKRWNGELPKIVDIKDIFVACLFFQVKKYVKLIKFLVI